MIVGICVLVCVCVLIATGHACGRLAINYGLDYYMAIKCGAAASDDDDVMLME